ncbi:MAG: MFS transporter [Acidobacteriales bacterium]|nr:MFS transporter [Terriglobales bacterium]
MKKIFYGWWMTAAAFVTFGLAVGFPYYNLVFFYDYFQKAFGWSRADITLGFPLATIFTLWVGPLIVPRFSPRKLILVGTGLTFIALTCFGKMGSALLVYYAIWVLYTIGYFLSGPIPHQLIVSHWFSKNRGKAMGVLYVGVGLLGSLGSFLVKPLTESYGFQTALIVMGFMLFLAWPLTIFVLRDKPSDKGLFADGASAPPAEIKLQPCSYKTLLGSYSFWLLLIGSACSISSIGAVNFHMKFAFIDQGFTNQEALNSVWRAASILILWSSIAGRLLIGGLSDAFPKKWVMTASYFLTALSIPLLLAVRPPGTPWAFSLLFGLAMGADYMLIPLMAAEQFGVNSLARAMAIILPVNTIGQTWFPYFISILRDKYYPNYEMPMMVTLAVALAGAVAIMILPRQCKRSDAALPLQQPVRTGK